MMLLRVSLRSPLCVVERINYFDAASHSYRTLCGMGMNSIMELIMVPTPAETQRICLVCHGEYEKRRLSESLPAFKKPAKPP